MGGNNELDKKNLWAPWRIGYIQGLDESVECFVCHNLENPCDDDKNLVFSHQVFIDEKPTFYSFSNETNNMTGAEIFAKFAPPPK